MVITRLAGTCFMLVTLPDGHRTVSSRISFAFPSPKWARGSLHDAKLPPAFSSLVWVIPSVTTMTRAPTPKRLLDTPTSRIKIQ